MECGVVVADVIDLKGGVLDAVLAGEELFEVAAPGVAILVAADEHVSRESREAAGGLFEQDVDGVAQELPGASQDEQADEDADQGVGVAPAGEDDDAGGSYGSQRAERVGEHVPQSALGIEALPF